MEGPKRGADMSQERPPEVRQAIFAGDRNTLSAMGKKGGEKAADNRAIKDALRDAELEKLKEEQAKLYSTSPEGDVLPPP